MSVQQLIKPLMFVALLAALAGCGRAGALQPPPASAQTAGDDSGTNDTKADKPFVLDGLLN